MSGHWPYIVAAYTICFVLFTVDWFASANELKNLKRDAIRRQRRDSRDQSNKQNSMDTSNE